MICLTFDIEERFHSNLTVQEAPKHWKMRDRILQIIDLLERHNKKATFFIVGELAAQYPDIIKKLARPGFEAASHSFYHHQLHRTSRRAAKEGISRSKKLIEDLTGQPVYGFRAPSWSARITDTWLWDHLVSEGFRYDASLFPFKTNMYGSFANPAKPFRLHHNLLEIPPSLFQKGLLRIPYGGGFYFRLYPFRLTELMINKDISSGKKPVVYFHPWEFEYDDEKLERGMNRFIGNYNIRSNWRKLTRLLAEYQTTTMLELSEESGDVPEYPWADIACEGQR
jgi:polysaccharide deacetylase family protein (PEP-CTERM system associated)